MVCADSSHLYTILFYTKSSKGSSSVWWLITRIISIIIEATTNELLSSKLILKKFKLHLSWIGGTIDDLTCSRILFRILHLVASCNILPCDVCSFGYLRNLFRIWHLVASCKILLCEVCAFGWFHQWMTKLCEYIKLQMFFILLIHIVSSFYSL